MDTATAPQWCDVQGKVEFKDSDLPKDAREGSTDLATCPECRRRLWVQALRRTANGWRATVRRHHTREPGAQPP